MDLIGYLEPFYRAWKELNTEEKENLYGAALMVKGRMVKVDPKLGFYTKVEPDFVEDHKKKMSWVEGSGYVILIPASLALPLKLISWLPTGSQDCAMDWFHLLSRKSSKVGWILEEGYTSVPSTNVARKLRESVGGDEADLI